MQSGRPATVRWAGGVEGELELLDQRALPARVEILRLNRVDEVWQAIRTLAVRGAPAIGVAAAYGMVMAARGVPPDSQAACVIDALRRAAAHLKEARPTAVNLEWAVDHMVRAAIAHRGIGVRPLQQRLLDEANEVLRADADMCLAIGRHGVDFIRPGIGVLTHCNAGALAASDHGTALAILYEAQRRGVPFRVFADETRPLLQGARLTAWEMQASGIDTTLICDDMAGLVMQQGKIGLVLVGADRIARNGDVANKVGTYSVAVLAKAHRIPFVVAAPSNTFDLSLADGGGIPIEERPGEEITEGFGKRTAPTGIATYNPACDVTPHDLITAIVTERGIISPITEPNIHQMVECVTPQKADH